MDHFIIEARPQPYDVIPYKITAYSKSLKLSSTNPYINVLGRSFINVKNVYLSASDPSILSNITYYNPFSAFKNLSAANPSFYGTILNQYVIQNSKYITFETTDLFKSSGYIDIIIENEAGYGKLTTGSFVPAITAEGNILNYQRPSVSGIHINFISI